jgi:hypothetical protein
MKRPGGLVAIAVVALVVGAAQIVASLGYFEIASIDWLAITELTGDLTGYVSAVSYAAGAALAALGLGALVFGVAALAMRGWAWVLGTAVFALDVLLALAMLLAAGIGVTAGVIGIVGAVMLWYLSVPEVREAFGHPVHPVTGGRPHAA